MRCPSCGSATPSQAHFCPQCGRAIEASAPASHVADGEAAPLWTRQRGERRHLTVMFCDLVESTRLGERLDAEELRKVVGAYQETCAKVIERFEGHVAQYLGDGLLVYFSYPRAHEDDAERAVRAGLDILAGLEEVNARLESELGVRLAVRIGIHTGDVVVGEVGGGQQRETLALGRTVNLAARLRDVAEPNSVVISDEALRLVRGLFIVEALGVRAMRGIADPVAVHRVVRASGVATRLEAAVATGLTPLVGRERDLDLLLDRWDRACDGDGQVVLVRGDPGIGKSRLVRALRDRLAEERPLWLECRGSPYHQNSAFHPVVELLWQGLALAKDAAGPEQLTQLERALAGSAFSRRQVVALFAGLLSIELPESYAQPELSPEAGRRRTLEALAGWLLSLTGRQPVVLVVEDLHWIDPSSLELLDALIQRAPKAPMLLIATFRPIFEPRWAPQPHLTLTVVEPLTRRQTVAMVDAVTAGRALPRNVLEQVVKKTDGVPLFVEELVRSVIESDLLEEREGRYEERRAVGGLAIPSTLQDSLMARLDRLGAAKELAQLAAVLGREFSYDLLAAVARTDDAALGHGLSQLETAGFLHRRGEAPGACYVFRHALIQEAAEQSLLKRTRRDLHAQIADVLEQRFPDRVEAEPETIAWHCEQGELIDKAIAYYQRAGERASERSANAEAIGHLSRGIELLRQLPNTPERAARELVLQVSLGRPLVAAKSFGSAEAERAYERARELCREVGDTPQFRRVISGLVSFYTTRAKLDTAHELATQMLGAVQGEQDASVLVTAHQQMALLRFFRGEMSASVGGFERALALCEQADHRSLTQIYGYDLRVWTRSQMAWALWIHGEPDRALATSRRAIEIGRSSAHPFSHAYALLWAAVVHTMRREHEAAAELSHAAFGIAEEQDFAFIVAGARLIRAWGEMNPQREDEAFAKALEEYRQAMMATAQTGSVGCGPQILGSLAEAYGHLGQHEQAQATLEAAFLNSQQTAQPYWDAELHRLRGELLLARGAPAEQAEACFRSGLDVSQRQQARSLELRSATSLGQLWQRQGRIQEARDLLVPLLDRFSEGFETADLQNAKTLLD